MKSRRHHYVPQCYLEAFSSPSSTGKVYAIDLKNVREFWPHIRNVAVEHDFNRIDSPNIPIDALENKLANTYESDLANILTAVRSGGQIDDSHFDGLFML